MSRGLRRFGYVVDEPTSGRRPAPSLTDLLQALYPDPSEFDTAEAFVRHHHDDVRYLTDEELEDHLFLGRLRRACEHATPRRPTEWISERVQRLNAELARRRKAARR